MHCESTRPEVIGVQTDWNSGRNFWIANRQQRTDSLDIQITGPGFTAERSLSKCTVEGSPAFPAGFI